MKTKKEIVENWLPRYTGLPLDQFGKYILLTNFQNYVDRFAEWQGVEVVGRDRSMPCATDGEITIINFSMGSANAATIFTVGFHNEIPTGALLLVSDNPMVPEGVKTEESDKQVSKNFVGEHLRIGIDSLRQLINNGITVKHLKF